MFRPSKIEKETIINFNEAEELADVYTHNVKLINLLERLRQNDPSVIAVREDNYSKTYTVPKSWVKLQPPRQLSEEQRQKMRDRARDNFCK